MFITIIAARGGRAMKQKMIPVSDLWDCETCFHSRNTPEGARCSSSAVWCEHGEAYRPAYNKLHIVEIEIDNPVEKMNKSKTGEWIISSDGYYPYCSLCRYELPRNADIREAYECPKCGAIMLYNASEFYKF